MVAVQTTNQITGKRKWWALATVMMTMFFASMNQTVVSTAIPTIVSDLSGFEYYAWLFSAFMITSAVTVPIYGKLSDVYGRRPFYLFGLIVFAIGSVLAGLAESMMWLIVARAIQGIGAGAMMTMPNATIGDIFNPKERGKWMGVLGIVFGISSIIGPTLGGFITQQFGWEWVFFVNLPFAVLAIIGVYFTLPKVKTEDQVKVDWTGSFLLIAGLLPIMIGLTWVGDRFGWTDWQVVTVFIVGIIILTIFVLFERRVKDAIIEMSFFKNKIFSITVVLALFVTMAMFGTIMFLPLYIQGVVGLTVQQSGIVMTPLMLSFIIGATLTGQLMSRTGTYKRYAFVGATLMLIGLFLFNQMDVNTTFWTVMINMAVFGIGIGSLMPIMNVSVQNAFPYKQMGQVNANLQFSRSLAGVIAAPVFGAILNAWFLRRFNEVEPSGFNELSDSAQQDILAMDPQQLITREAQESVESSFAAVGPEGEALYQEWLHAIQLSLSSGISALFFVGLIFAVLTLVCVIFLPEYKLQEDEYYEEEKQEST
ncbi:EmrB/QacA subfamily drug resistance transporter [Alkalibacillus filiformis]|uniref:EmrB/QacA subfamily drug resistance transporter n=1 Tax=Alkalibacillus filiformis TaxID=200990 RepID=A0ABU0DU40_9BACI|nr:MDR family MFS transporter [Alkalibacillus filiformis]MDQ0351806.1 EmrB/QacA subfamily drug resistance transporter [Alkalibacillus filiformis]